MSDYKKTLLFPNIHEMNSFVYIGWREDHCGIHAHCGHIWWAYANALYTLGKYSASTWHSLTIIYACTSCILALISIVAVNHNFNIFAPLPPSNIYKSFWNRNSHLQSGPYLSLTGVFMMGYCCLFDCLMILWATVAYSAALCYDELQSPNRQPY